MKHLRDKFRKEYLGQLISKFHSKEFRKREIDFNVLLINLSYKLTAPSGFLCLYIPSPTIKLNKPIVDKIRVLSVSR